MEEDGKHITEFIDDNRDKMIEDICQCVEKLKDPKLNRKIGMAGHKRWKELTEWTDKKQREFELFMGMNL